MFGTVNKCKWKHPEADKTDYLDGNILPFVYLLEFPTNKYDFKQMPGKLFNYIVVN